MAHDQIPSPPRLAFLILPNQTLGSSGHIVSLAVPWSKAVHCSLLGVASIQHALSPAGRESSRGTESGAGGVIFAELEAVCVSGTPKIRDNAWFMEVMKLRSHRKDFYLCPKSNGREMSLTGFRQGAMIGSAVERSLWSRETQEGAVSVIRVEEALRAPSPGTDLTPTHSTQDFVGYD